MIVKVMRNADDWCIIDGIEDLQVNRFVNKGEIEQKGCFDSTTYRVVASVFDENKPTDSCVHLVYRDRRGDWCTIVFNTEAFICSDSGKTIERIYG